MELYDIQELKNCYDGMVEAWGMDEVEKAKIMIEDVGADDTYERMLKHGLDKLPELVQAIIKKGFIYIELQLSSKN